MSDVLVIITHKYKDYVTWRYPSNINILTGITISDTHKSIGSLMPLWMLILCMIHSLIYTSNDGTYHQCVSQCQHACDINSQIQRFSHFEIPTKHQYWIGITIFDTHEPVGSLIPLWMSIIRTMHSLIYHSNIGTYTLSFIS